MSNETNNTKITILFEGEYYNPKTLENFLPKKIVSKYNSEKGLNYIGYYNKGKDTKVFLLPKLFNKDNRGWFDGGSKTLDKGKIATITFGSMQDGVKEPKLAMLPSWLSKALEYYRERKINQRIVNNVDELILRPNNPEGDSPTLYERIHGLEEFLEEHQDLIVTIYQQAHTGYNKVNWSKTVRTKHPFIYGNPQSVVYMDLVTKRKTVDCDEQLMVLLFNTLQYINDHFHYEIEADHPYTLMPSHEFENMVENGMVTPLLLDIKDNYFSDTMCELWSLLYAYHDKEDELRFNPEAEDYMLVSDFDRVFEDMVDSLLSDEKDELFTKKHQSDNKRIDHLFLGKSIFDPNKQICYIGDSKYYSDGKDMNEFDKGKQFVYAKNIIQDATNDILDPKGKGWGKAYRDELTEGYDIIPNFFLIGIINEDDDLENINTKGIQLEPKDMADKKFYAENKQFDNRLFDRDTLFLLKYTVNFLFILRNYNRKNAFVHDKIKHEVEDKVRIDMIRRLNAKYYFYRFKDEFEFWQYKCSNSKKEFINKNFKKLIGKIFMVNNQLILAYDQNNKDAFWHLLNGCPEISNFQIS